MRFPENFYGFPDVPFHVYLGMTFTRQAEDGPATVTVPALDRHAGPDGRQSAAAVYTLGEIACGVQVCDAVRLDLLLADDSTAPLVLTKAIAYQPLAPAYGELRSETWSVGDEEAVRDRLATRRRAAAESDARMYDEHGTLVGTMHTDFYVRIMERSRFEAMTGTLMPTLAGQGARA